MVSDKGRKNIVVIICGNKPDLEVEPYKSLTKWEQCEKETNKIIDIASEVFDFKKGEGEPYEDRGELEDPEHIEKWKEWMGKKLKGKMR